MKFSIGTTSERKINTAKKVLTQLITSENVLVTGYPAQSGVGETPWDKQTYDGARNRALDCKKNGNNADFYIGLESGLVKRYGHLFEEAWCCVIDAHENEFFGYSSGLKVPDYVIQKMDELHFEHWQVMKLLEEEHGHSHDDTWGNYTKGKLLRDISLEEALRNAFVQAFADEESYYKKG